MSIKKRITALITTFTLIVATSVPVLAAGPVHTVTFVYGAKQCVVPVEHGKNVKPPTDTYVPGYSFIGWLGNAHKVTEDRIILGSYMPAGYTNFQVTHTGPVMIPTPAVPATPVPTPATPDPAPISNTYRVHFVDGLTGEEYYGQTVSEGADANPPEVPHHDGYHFECYDGSYTGVTSECTVTARYEEDDHWHDTYDKQWWHDHGGDAGDGRLL